MNTHAHWTPIVASHDCSSAACYGYRREQSETLMTETEFVNALLQEHGVMMAKLASEDFSVAKIGDVDNTPRLN